jgi:hypothetical protein
MTHAHLSGILQDALSGEQCQQAVLVSGSGAIVSSLKGNPGCALDPRVGPIAATAFRAANHLNQLLGATEATYHLHRGAMQDLALFPMPAGLILAATFPAGTAEKSVQALAATIEARIEVVFGTGKQAESRQQLGEEMRQASQALLDQLFAHPA